MNINNMNNDKNNIQLLNLICKLNKKFPTDRKINNELKEELIN
jgi:hypothetical protein